MLAHRFQKIAYKRIVNDILLSSLFALYKKDITRYILVAAISLFQTGKHLLQKPLLEVMQALQIEDHVFAMRNFHCKCFTSSVINAHHHGT